MLKRNIFKQHKPKKKGQSTVEYIVLVAAIIFALILFLRQGGIFQSAFNKALISGTNGMEFTANLLQDSRPLSP